MKAQSQYQESKTDLCAALNCVRQATLCLPEEMEEIYDDLKWVEESLEAAITEQQRQEASDVFEDLGGMGA